MLKSTPPASPRPLVPEHGAGNPGEKTRLSISRNYVIPPRPKPGRKPSSEVPPSRRKAQNREAQRAFRERKSQAVRVLEAQLAEQARQFEEQQLRMQQQIEDLRKEKVKFQHSPPATGGPRTPQSVIAFPQLAIIPSAPASPQPLSPLGSQQMSSAVSPLGTAVSPLGTAVSPLGTAVSPLGTAVSPVQPVQMGSPPALGTPFGVPQTSADVVGLELLDHVLEQKLPVSPSDSAPRARRPSRSNTAPESPRSPGVMRTSPPVTSNPLDLVNTSWSQPPVPLRRRPKMLETDFTTMFSRRRSSAARPVTLTLPPTPKDRCGFCTDNSMCICAASAAREEAGVAIDTVTLGSPLSSFALGPPSPAGSPGSPGSPSSITSATSHPPAAAPPPPVKTEPAEESGECTGNPQTCSQCRYDPMLTLFCSAISSKRSPPTLQGTYIPAQAAYKTLSRHPRFGSADLGEVVDALSARGSQVDVNSIAKVLRILDTQ